jgi:hypothetical protein
MEQALSSLFERVASQMADSDYEAAELLSPDDLSAAEHELIPSWWVEATQQPSADKAIEVVISQWNNVLPGRLTATFDLFRRRTAGVYLARLRSGVVVLVYALHDESGDADLDPFVCWYGNPPPEHLANERIDLDLLPNGIRALYTQLHGYFCMAGFGSTGFMPTEELFRLSGGDPAGWTYEKHDGRDPDGNNMVPILLHDNGSVCIELGGNGNDDTICGWLLYEASLVYSGSMWEVIDHRLSELCDEW